MLTLEQFHNSELSRLYTKQYADEPLNYQATIFSILCRGEVLKKEDADIMALHFFAPIYMLLTICDRHPERETESLKMLERHIRQFSRIYKETTKG